MTERVFHTTLYSEKAWALIRSFLYNVRNGHWCGTRASGKFDDSKLMRADDGEIVWQLYVRDGYCSWRRTIWHKCRLNDQKMRDEIAWLVKCMVHQFAGKKCWSRDNTTDLTHCFVDRFGGGAQIEAEIKKYLSGITVRDIYCFYELLRNRKNIEVKYGKELIDEWRGAQFDPVRTELECAKREQMAEFERQENAAITELRTKCESDIRAMRDKLYEERDAALQKVHEEFKQKREELLSQIQAALAFSA